MKRYFTLKPGHRGNYDQLRGLVDLILHVPNDITVAEIGCYDGASSELWMMKCHKLYCIDWWHWTMPDCDEPCEVVEKRFDDRMATFGRHVVKLKGRSDDMSIINSIPDRSLDGVYIDGNHSYEGVCSDIRIIIPKLKDRAFIAGHDFQNPDTPGVTRAVNDVLGGAEIVFQDWSWMNNFLRNS